MTEHEKDDDRLEKLDERIAEARRDLKEIEGAEGAEGTDDEPRFSDDGMIEKGIGTDTNAPPG